MNQCRATIVSSLKHKNTQPIYIFNRENPQNSEPQNGLRRELDFIALIPGDGVANPYEICLALSHLAAQRGVKIVQNCKLEEIESKNGKVTGVKTNLGSVSCENFVNTAGFWARHVGNLSDPRVQVPMHPAEHYYLHSKPVSFLPQDCPVVRYANVLS